MTSKPNRAERIINFLESRYPGWVPAIELEPVGGRQAWRSAVAEARTLLRQREGRFDPDDDPLPNQLRYRYVHALDCPSWQAWDVANSCKGCTMERITLSSYRLQKRGESTQTPQDESSLALAHGVEGSKLGDPRGVPNEKAASDSHDLNEWGLR